MNGQRNNLEPILCAHLLRQVDDKLIDLLRLFEPREWDLQTIAPLWKVRDVAAHLLDTPLRKLFMVRDSNCLEHITRYSIASCEGCRTPIAMLMRRSEQ
jgi:hypothetical protein